MAAKLEQTPATNVNPLLSVDKSDFVLYSNEAGNFLLNEWGIRVGEKLPLSIADFVQRVFSRNSPEKIEVKVGNGIYLIVFSPLPEQELVSISGFYISDFIESKEDLQETYEDRKRKQNEEVLLESNSYLQLALESACAGMWILGEDGSWIASTQLNSFFGLPPDAPPMRKDLFPSFIYPDDFPRLQKAWNEAINGQSSYEEEYRVIWPDGSVHWLVSKGRIISDAGIPLFVGITFNITDRKQIEEALKKSHEILEEKVKARAADLDKAYNSLKESETRLKEAQEIAHIGNWEWDIVTGKVHWSDEIFRIFGYDPQEVDADYNLFFNHVHPDDRDSVNNSVKNAFNGEPNSRDYRIVSHNVERVVHSYGEVIFDEENIPIQMKGTTQDITWRKQAEEELKKTLKKLHNSEDQLRVLIKNVKSGIALVDEIGRFVLVNPTFLQIFGLDNELDILNINSQDWTRWEVYEEDGKLLHVDDHPVRKAGMTGKPVIEQLVAVKNPGAVKLTWLLISAEPIIREDGQMCMVCTYHDITKRKQAEKALEKIEIARKKEIHHRIKNNLQVISSLLDLQAEMFKGRKNIEDLEVLEALKESQDRVISMALIHEELHKCGEIDTLNFSNYIEELTKNLLLTYRLGNEDISLDKDFKEDIFFDIDTAVPLGIIINELISNSLKYAFPDRDNGKIQIKLHQEENGECKSEDRNLAYVLTVSDNGVGIHENLDIEDLDSLGLQLVTTLVEQMDGELELRRDNGTEFIIRFSVKEE